MAMSTQTVTRTPAPEDTTIPHETDLHTRLAELLANAKPSNAQPSADPTRHAVLESLSDLPGMDPALQEFYARVLPWGAAPVACSPFWPCA
jgi:hypothetical protein